MAAKKKKKAKTAKRSPAKKVRKKVARKASKKSAVRKKAPGRRPSPQAAAPKGYVPAPGETKIGEVEDYFSRIGVIATTLKAPLALGETIHIHGHTTDITQSVESMQIEHAAVQKAKKGDAVGIKVGDKCRKGDDVYKL